MKITNNSIFKALVALCRLSAVFILAFIIIFVFIKGVSAKVLHISEYLLIIGVLIIAVLNVIPPSFFSLERDQNLLLFKFFSVSPFRIISFSEYSKKQVNITKSSLIEYKINKKLFGLKKSLVLIVNSERGNASYPPIDISYISEKKLRKIMDI